MIPSKRTIFVFGSNTEGRHGAGAALEARLKWGAVNGCPMGLLGNSYAIVTKDLSKGKRSIPLDYIENQVLELFHYIKGHPDWEWRITAIGCGLAGYTPEEIAPMFRNSPPNAILPEEFIKVLL